MRFSVLTQAQRYVVETLVTKIQLTITNVLYVIFVIAKYNCKSSTSLLVSLSYSVVLLIINFVSPKVAV